MCIRQVLQLLTAIVLALGRLALVQIGWQRGLLPPGALADGRGAALFLFSVWLLFLFYICPRRGVNIDPGAGAIALPLRGWCVIPLRGEDGGGVLPQRDALEEDLSALALDRAQLDSVVSAWRRSIAIAEPPRLMM